MNLLNIALLAGIALGTWWLTGFDKTVGGYSKRGHHLTRTLRVIAVVFLSWAFVGMIESPGGGYGGIPLLTIIPMCIALVLRSSLAEVFTHGFLGFLDPQMHDTREFDPKKTRRYQDALAHLINTGQREQAIKLCEELKQSGELDLVTIENTLEFLGVKQDRLRAANPLNEVSRLRTLGDFAGAEKALKQLLQKNPADEGAALMLMRLYAQDLRQPNLAREVLRAWEKQPHVSAAHVEFARRSIDEWSRAKPPPLPPSAMQPKAESLEELLAAGAFGSAVEMLESQVKANPGDFDLQMKLAEVYAVNCQNLVRASKMVEQIERFSKFSPQQIEMARAKAREWHLK